MKTHSKQYILALAAGLVLSGAAIVASPAAAIQLRVGVNIGGPDRWGGGPDPVVVEVDNGPVYYCGDYPGWDVFRYGVGWYGFHNGAWYYEPRYRGRWVPVRVLPHQIRVAYRADFHGQWRSHGHGDGRVVQRGPGRGRPDGRGPRGHGRPNGDRRHDDH